LCLLLAVDDATWEATAKFDKSEWIVPTFNFWKEYIEEKWKPRWIYLDKFATYKINHPNATNDKELPTQFWKACKTLWIGLIFAHSAEWKWRVERMNYTLQDRLVKELRLAGIATIEEANKFLKEYIPKFNAKFSVVPQRNQNLHKKLSADIKEKMPQIFSIQNGRKINNDYTIMFKTQYFQLDEIQPKILW